uniref:Hypoxia up-regulated protein 1 n=1 Tax=Panagrolaimus superbus TaxID=310955 RepID=A0A914ZEZ3_9BILA
MWPMSSYPSLQRFPSYGSDNVYPPSNSFYDQSPPFVEPYPSSYPSRSLAYDYQPSGMSYGGPALGSRAHDVAMASLTNYVYDKDNFHVLIFLLNFLLNFFCCSPKIRQFLYQLIFVLIYTAMVNKPDFGLRISADSLTAFIYSPEGKIRIIKDADGIEKTGYFVSFANNKVIIGKGAEEDLESYPDSVIYDFFDMLGLSDQEITVNEKWNFQVFSVDGAIEIGFHDGEEQCRISVQDLLAVFLNGIKKNVEDFLGYEVSTVKVHVQLGITGSQKTEVLHAIQMIGLSAIK